MKNSKPRDPNKRTNWRVRVYDVNEKVISTWVIQNRTEHEAESEATADVVKEKGYADWSMMEEG